VLIKDEQCKAIAVMRRSTPYEQIISNVYRLRHRGGVVQMVEYMLCTHQVIGSIPIISNPSYNLQSLQQYNYSALTAETDEDDSNLHCRREKAKLASSAFLTPLLQNIHNVFNFATCVFLPSLF
jgi:hypothetical protein